jgi:hypothetical protein
VATIGPVEIEVVGAGDAVLAEMFEAEEGVGSEDAEAGGDHSLGTEGVSGVGGAHSSGFSSLVMTNPSTATTPP